MESKLNKKISGIIKELEKEISAYKKSGFSAEKVRKIINICYIKPYLQNAGLYGYLSQEQANQAMVYIENKLELKIKEFFYEKFPSEKFHAPNLDKFDLNVKHKSRVVGNAIESEIENIAELEGQSIKTKYDCGKKACDIHQEFTKDGKLITSCKNPIDNRSVVNDNKAKVEEDFWKELLE